MCMFFLQVRSHSFPLDFGPNNSSELIRGRLDFVVDILLRMLAPACILEAQKFCSSMEIVIFLDVWVEISLEFDDNPRIPFY